MELSDKTARQLYEEVKANPARKKFGFGEKAALPLAQIRKRAESALGMPAGAFATYRTNLLFVGQIQKVGDASDLRYFR